MDTILDSFASDKLFPNPNLLDLEDLNESDFLTNVVSVYYYSDFSDMTERPSAFVRTDFKT